jgi:ketosteroid isomerase-like protein
MTQEAELRATFTAIGKALGRNDREALTRLYAEEYQGHSIRGDVENRDMVLATYGSGDVRRYKMTDVEMKVEVQGDVGLISGSGIVSGTWGETEFSHLVRFLEVYLWRDSRWQCYRSQCTEIRPA